MIITRTETRALRYRRLALAEPDPQAAALLRKLADEADKAVLCTFDRAAPAVET
jgi:predicted NAD/FAD-dependent oxidoreductase